MPIVMARETDAPWPDR